MKEIRVANEEEFERLRDRIDLEASDAADHWHLLKALDASFNQYHLEINESWTFWSLTLTAHRDAVLFHLCRLYDKDSAALSLGRFLLTVRSNIAFFSDSAFRRRLQENPHVDTLAAGRGVNLCELATEIASVSQSDPTVARLHTLRNTVLSHRDADAVRRGARAALLRSLPVEDIEALLERAQTLTAKYSLLFKASLYGSIAGADDYKNLLGMLREARSAHEARIAEEIRAASEPEKPVSGPAEQQ